MKQRYAIRLVLLCALITILSAGVALAQASSRGPAASGFSRSDISKMQDEHGRDDRTLGKMTFKPVEGGFDVEFEKHPMFPVSARPYINGDKIKKDQCRGYCDGTLKVIVNRMVHGQRYTANCSAPAQLPAVAQIIAPPSGGIHCYFENTMRVAARIREIDGEAPLTDWEMQLSAEDFAKVGDCLDGNEFNSSGFDACVDRVGVKAETRLASKN